MQKINEEAVQHEKLRKLLVEKTSDSTGVPKDVVEKIVSFQFKDAKQAMIDCKEVTVGSFGTFKVSSRKLETLINSIKKGKRKAVEIYNNPLTTDRKKRAAAVRVAMMDERLRELEIVQEKVLKNIQFKKTKTEIVIEDNETASNENV